MVRRVRLARHGASPIGAVVAAAESSPETCYAPVEIQMSQIAAWLARLGLSKYAEPFAAHEVDFEAPRHLSDDDLTELGLLLGPRRQVLATLAETPDEETETRTTP